MKSSPRSHFCVVARFLTKTGSHFLSSCSRAFSDLIESDRRSKFLFLRIVFRSTGIHLSGKCSSVFFVLALCACAERGDLGREAPSTLRTVYGPAAGDLSSWLRGAPVSDFGLTDDETELRERAVRFLFPAHESDTRERMLAELVRSRILPPTWTLMEPDSYYERLISGSHRSPASLYRRLSEDSINDSTLLTPFAATARRVLAMDRVRLRALEGAEGLSAENKADLYPQARARITQNRCLIALVHHRAGLRRQSWQHALDRLVVETPDPAAIAAERSLLRIRHAHDPLAEFMTGPFDAPPCIGDEEEHPSLVMPNKLSPNQSLRDKVRPVFRSVIGK
jgi:hypothetical protein